jgi:hypothetical protein
MREVGHYIQMEVLGPCQMDKQKHTWHIVSLKV